MQISFKNEESRSLILIGVAVFNSSLDKKHIVSQYLRSMLTKKGLQITAKNYHYRKWKEIFKHMKSIKVQILNLSTNFHCNIIKQIQHLQFEKLVTLCLQNNRIHNIQAICNVYCPNLQLLYLNQNDISRIHCLNKLNPVLRQLRINQNPIYQVRNMSRMKINCQIFLGLGLSGYEHFPSQLQDLSILVKMATQGIRYLGKLFFQIDLALNKNIRQIKIFRMLKKKYPNINMAQQLLFDQEEDNGQLDQQDQN